MTSERARAGAIYLGAIAGYYLVAGAMAFAISHWVPSALAIVVLAAQVLAMGAVTVLTYLYEEDWWNDFRDQHRAIVVGLLANLIVVGVASWIGMY